MRFDNPFTPAFGGRPEHFFGRALLLEGIKGALEGSADVPKRVLFITGPRGSGKTALLERISQLARDLSWMSIDVHSTNAVQEILESLAESGKASVSFSPEVKALGASVSLGTASASTTTHTSTSLTRALLSCYESLGRKRGVLITIDEAQKISEADMEQICTAVQMVRRKGNPIALMLAGLPGTKERVATYRGCTFMQRVRDEQIGSLLRSETHQAFADTLAFVPGLTASDEAVWAAASFSQGYPYLVQLTGYYLVELLRETQPVGMMTLAPKHVEVISDEVYGIYCDDVLHPSTRSLGKVACSYLTTMSQLLAEDGTASTGEVARTLGKSLSQLSSCRQDLIKRRLIREAGYGKVRFALPYLSRFAVEPATEIPSTSEDEWDIR